MLKNWNEILCDDIYHDLLEKKKWKIKKREMKEVELHRTQKKQQQQKMLWKKLLQCSFHSEEKWPKIKFANIFFLPTNKNRMLFNSIHLFVCLQFFCSVISWWSFEHVEWMERKYWCYICNAYCFNQPTSDTSEYFETTIQYKKTCMRIKKNLTNSLTMPKNVLL